MATFAQELFQIMRSHCDTGTMTATARHPDKDVKVSGNLATIPAALEIDDYADAAAHGFGPRVQDGGMGAKGRLSGVVATNVVRALLTGASGDDLRTGVGSGGGGRAGGKKKTAPRVKRQALNAAPSANGEQ